MPDISILNDYFRRIADIVRRGDGGREASTPASRTSS